MKRPTIIAFGSAGSAVAREVAELTGGTLEPCGPGGKEASRLLPRLFAEGTPIIGVCAAGILIRLLAPHLGDKREEPPVLAVSADGAHVVPLLGGHRGANRLAREIAAHLGGHAALTTASDTRFLHGLDEPPEGWVLANPASAKPAMAAILAGAEVALLGEAPWLAAAGYPLAPGGSVSVFAGEGEETPAGALVYRPRTLVAGVGCERGTEAEEAIALIKATLVGAGLSPLALAAIASIDIKADETALHEAAAYFGVPLRLFTPAELEMERPRLLNPSAIVEAEVGVAGVAEAAALKAGHLLVPKQKSRRATCAIGRADAPLAIENFGRAPGHVHIVGIGPGDAASRTAAALNALDVSTDWVGYGLYLDLIADLRHGQALHDFPLGEEEMRVRHALELAAKGKTVALVSSGDAQIFAMAALAFELLCADGARALSPAARRVGVTTHPGISALQAASAAAGALIGHDFCAVSLSDLLTPREVILNRLDAAARGDFVTALYNPRSRRRTDLLDHAHALFLAHRPADTPVIVAANLGRAEETVRIVALAEFDPAEVDMLTIVLIGASSSRTFRRGDGRTVAFTPRGYERKAAAGVDEVSPPPSIPPRKGEGGEGAPSEKSTSAVPSALAPPSPLRGGVGGGGRIAPNAKVVR